MGRLGRAHDVRRPAAGLAGALVLSLWGFPVVSAHADSTSALALTVSGTGTDAGNDCTASAAPCRTIARAVDIAAGPLGADRDVRIDVGPGRFVPGSGGVRIAAGAERSLTIAGAGPVETTLQLPADRGDAAAISVESSFEHPVSVTALGITGVAHDGVPGAAGGFAIGIRDRAAAALTVTRARIFNLMGGNAGGPVPQSAAGAEGGSTYGIDRTGGPTSIVRTAIGGLHGGAGGGDQSARHGGNGGAAGGVTTDSALHIFQSDIGAMYGGRGGPGAGGGDAYSATTQSYRTDQPTTITDSEFSDNVGGPGGAGTLGAAGNAGTPGGTGGDAVGLSYVGAALTIRGAMVGGQRGGTGGAGGTGGPGEGGNTAGAGGRGGGGGAAVGVLASDPGGLAAFTVNDSTIGDNVAGPGGHGGGGGRNSGGTGGNGGSGGAAGLVGAGLVALADVGTILSSAATHVTVVANGSGAGGPGGDGGGGTATGEAGLTGAPSNLVAGIYSNSLLTLAASLLANPDGFDCKIVRVSSIDSGWNVTSDTTCLHQGTGSRTVPRVGAALGVPKHNGGPTRTRALPADSSAADAVPVSSGLCDGASGTDQRGEPRPGVGAPAHCAAGAFEPHRY